MKTILDFKAGDVIVYNGKPSVIIHSDDKEIGLIHEGQPFTQRTWISKQTTSVDYKKLTEENLETYLLR